MSGVVTGRPVSAPGGVRLTSPIESLRHIRALTVAASFFVVPRATRRRKAVSCQLRAEAEQAGDLHTGGG
jgi:hypothetical protein